MLHPQPPPGWGKGKTPQKTLLETAPWGGRQVEQVLLHKIGLLAAQHSRNAETLHRLRSSKSIKASTDDTDLPPRYETISPARSSKRWLSKDDFKMNDMPETCLEFLPTHKYPFKRRSFTRVTASSGSCWKHTPTVVKPFRSMETHTTAWKRKIRQQEEQDFKSRKEEEEAKAKKRERFILAVKEGTEFAGVIARSNEMMDRRRQTIIEAEAKEEETRKRREFKARPAHITGEDWQTIRNRQAVRRKQRIQTRKYQMAKQSNLPRRMAMHALLQKATAAGTNSLAAHRKTSDESKAHDNRTLVPPDRIREVLARKQQLWDDRLAATKWTKKLVVPQVLPMEERQKMYTKRAQERAQREKDKTDLARQLAEDVERRRNQKAFSASVPVAPRTTHSFLIKTAQTQAKLAKERCEIQRETDREKKMRARQDETKNHLAEVMRRIDREQGRQFRRDTHQEAEHKSRESHEKYRRALKENKARLEQATADRPTLWEQHDTEVRKEAAKRMALSTIMERVLREGSSREEGAYWKRGSAADNIFDEEEKAALGMSSFLT